jgi:hypothetical protein
MMTVFQFVSPNCFMTIREREVENIVGEQYRTPGREIVPGKDRIVFIKKAT